MGAIMARATAMLLFHGIEIALELPHIKPHDTSPDPNFPVPFSRKDPDNILPGTHHGLSSVHLRYWYAAEEIPADPCAMHPDKLRQPRLSLPAGLPLLLYH